MKQLLSVEWKKALTLNRILMCLAIIFIPTTVQFLYVKTGYQFYRPVEVHTEMIGGIIALLFPILFIIIYSNSYASEIKDNFITYMKSRTKLSNYLLAKGIVNAVLTFAVAFSMVFVSFVLIVYIEPLLNIVVYETRDIRHVSVGTFEIFLSYGTLTYGLVYSFWVAVNAVLYSTASYVLTIIIKNNFLALSLPFLWYFVVNYAIAILGFPQFSMSSTAFPFNITQQPIWTIFVPFTTNIMILFSLIFYVKTHFQEKVFEHAS
ncbi:ABC transporter permease [Bacillus lacus]|uniref:ABC transporter permease n=1 Tax=Metabacillus lacus TaxID=1983721 RepID=A0A7X2IYR0_9BACI|nr:ABC transporter permease [Metabacillus lacus]MRX72131.1 ABC transporter permease [Metabacillus lacus]